MPILLWDASALVKRYATESGSATVIELFALTSSQPMVVTVLGYTETWASLVRKRNQGSISPATLASALSLLHDEILAAADFDVLPLDYDAVLFSVTLISNHSLNSADAAILTSYLRYSQAASAVGETCVLIAADQRLLNAAQAEGLPTLNPEALPAADVAAFLAGL